MNDKLIYELMKNNKGLTSDDSIIIPCPRCNTVSDAVGEILAGSAGAYCFLCNHWFSYTYIKDHWYYSKTLINTYSTKYIGAPNYWEWITEIENIDLYKILWNKYKNTEYENVIVAELLSQNEYVNNNT